MRHPCFVPALALVLAMHALPAIAARPLEPGTTVQARLQSTDRPNDLGGRSHDYRLRLAEGQMMVVVARSGEFDPVLLVFQPDGDLLVENDDYARHSTDAAVVATAPETGLYTVRVNSLPMGGGHTGTYSVRALVLEPD